MPFDFTIQDMIPEKLNFDVHFEPTKVRDKKYVINGNTGEYIGVVGHTFTCASHASFFEGVHNTVTENLNEDETSDMDIKWRVARQNAWALMDITLPNVTARIETNKHSTTIAQRIIALHGIDGSCSNQTYFGAIDFFCTNGMIRGEHDKVRRKNSANFTIESFIRDLRESSQSFYAQSERLQKWAKKTLFVGDVKAMLESLDKGKANRLFSLYNQEASVRGENVWALYSAFTNYASYADERNGFNLRKTEKDSEAETMFQREHLVSKWIESTVFKELIAA